MHHVGLAYFKFLSIQKSVVKSEDYRCPARGRVPASYKKGWLHTTMYSYLIQSWIGVIFVNFTIYIIYFKLREIKTSRLYKCYFNFNNGYVNLFRRRFNSWFLWAWLHAFMLWTSGDFCIGNGMDFAYAMREITLLKTHYMKCGLTLIQAWNYVTKLWYLAWSTEYFL